MICFTHPPLYICMNIILPYDFLEIGDIIFTKEKGPLGFFSLVAKATGTWATHIGVVVGKDNQNNWIIAESTFPYSRIVSLDNFISRAEGQIEIRRIKGCLKKEYKNKLSKEANILMGQRYDPWFGEGLYCSKLVYEIYNRIGIKICLKTKIGDIVANTNISKFSIFLWRLWYGGSIPISQECITVIDILKSTIFETVYNKYQKY